MRRGFWFVAGAGVGVYAMTRARRAAEIFTPEGWSDRLSSLNLGAQLLMEEYRSARNAKEAELRERLGLDTTGSLALASASKRSIDPATPKELT